MDVTGRNPWKGNHFLTYLADLRDQQVDKLIHQARIADDPLADRNGDDMADDAIKRGRMKLIADYNIPAIIEVVCPSFLCEDGTRVPDTVLKAISTQ